MYGRTVFLDPKGLSFMENTLCSDFVLIIYPNRQNSLEVLQKKATFVTSQTTCDFWAKSRVARILKISRKSSLESLYFFKKVGSRDLSRDF